MKTETVIERIKRKRKFLMVLPLLVLPFIAMTFWALGGGKGKKDQQIVQRQGLNKELPEAKLSTDASDKMSVYSQADKDSIALQEQKKADPYAKRDSFSMGSNDSFAGQQFQSQVNPTGGYSMGRYTDPNEAKVTNKLAQLDRALNQSANDTRPYDAQAGSTANPEIEQLQTMMQSVKNDGTDAQMQQLNGMLEKLMDIQNPARAQQKLREQSLKNKGQVYAVSTFREGSSTDILSNDSPITVKEKFQSALSGAGNSFYDIEAAASPEDTMMQTAIAAVVNETQTLVSGATVKMRLMEDVFVNGVHIPSGTFVSGTCSIDGERLKIDVTGLRYGRNLFPVTLAVYDLDALEGIRIPGAITRDAAKDGTDRAIQSVQLMSLDPSIGAQAASAGVEAAKGLLGKKVKLIRVTVKAGHPILLLDAKTKQGLN